MKALDYGQQILQTTARVSVKRLLHFRSYPLNPPLHFSPFSLPLLYFPSHAFAVIPEVKVQARFYALSLSLFRPIYFHGRESEKCSSGKISMDKKKLLPFSFIRRLKIAWIFQWILFEWKKKKYFDL